MKSCICVCIAVAHIGGACSLAPPTPDSAVWSCCWALCCPTLARVFGESTCGSATTCKMRRGGPASGAMAARRDVSVPGRWSTRDMRRYAESAAATSSVLFQPTTRCRNENLKLVRQGARCAACDEPGLGSPAPCYRGSFALEPRLLEQAHSSGTLSRNQRKALQQI